MYISHIGITNWDFIPRDDAPEIGELIRIKCTLTVSGAYHFLTIRDTDGYPQLKAVARLGASDPASDRMVLDTIGATSTPDPQGSPWVVYASNKGTTPDTAPDTWDHTLIAIFYSQIKAASKTLHP